MRRHCVATKYPRMHIDRNHESIIDLDELIRAIGQWPAKNDETEGRAPAFTGARRSRTDDTALRAAVELSECPLVRRHGRACVCRASRYGDGYAIEVVPRPIAQFQARTPAMSEPHAGRLMRSARRTRLLRGPIALLLLAATLGAPPVFAGERRVEIVLSAALDEPRGYCLDIVGHQTRAQPSRGIHAHTCYSYQGRIATDQAFDAEELSRGVMKLPDWDVCVTATTATSGGRPGLVACADREDQRFLFRANGTIAPGSAPDLCLTVDSGTSRPGGGGNPPHVIRSLSLERCSAENVDVQRWRTRTAAK